MSKRIWNGGKPPHVGWFNASKSKSHQIWRWWNGKQWSMDVLPSNGIEEVILTAGMIDAYPEYIEWTDYWPENARVPRIKP